MTADGAVVRMHYTGLVKQTARFEAAAESDQATEWDEQYMRLSITFDTGDARYIRLDKVSLSPPAGCSARDGSNTPLTGLPSGDRPSTFTIASRIIVWMTERRTRLPACQFPTLHPQSSFEGPIFLSTD
jgi:hypothetical protein